MDVMETIKDCCDQLAVQAQVVMDLQPAYTKEQALDFAIGSAIDTARRALKREGCFSRSMTSDVLESYALYASVAEDARANTYRPSTGNVREYVLGLV